MPLKLYKLSKKTTSLVTDWRAWRHSCYENDKEFLLGCDFLLLVCVEKETTKRYVDGRQEPAHRRFYKICFTWSSDKSSARCPIVVTRVCGDKEIGGSSLEKCLVGWSSRQSVGATWEWNTDEAMRCPPWQIYGEMNWDGDRCYDHATICMTWGPT